MWKSMEEQRDDLAFVKGKVYEILDAMTPTETVKLEEFRKVLHELCNREVTKDAVEAGILQSLEDHLIEFLPGKFMYEIQAGDDTWDNRLSGDSDDDTRWSASLSRSRSVIKTA